MPGTPTVGVTCTRKAPENKRPSGNRRRITSATRGIASIDRQKDISTNDRSARPMLQPVKSPTIPRHPIISVSTVVRRNGQ